MTGLGIMSGSSLDGLDLAVVEFNHGGSLSWRMNHFASVELTDDLRSRLRQVHDMSVFDLAETEAHFTRYMAEAVRSLPASAASGLDYVSVHGHTVLHDPLGGFSWQLLNGGMLAALTGLNVVSDFRNQDMALGGQGAPMAVIADRDLFPGYDAYLNLGGIANISINKNGSWQAYDLFPFNQVLDHFARKLDQRFDLDGRLAAEGQPADDILAFLNGHRYLNLDPPKSLDNSEVMQEWIIPMEDDERSSRDILNSYVNFFADQMSKILEEGSLLYVTGGGARNSFAMQTLRVALDKTNVHLTLPDATIIDAKEAILMAYAGYLRLKAEPNFLPGVSGADSAVSAGAVYLPPIH